MKEILRKTLQYVVLCMVTAAAIGVMVFVSSKTDSVAATKEANVNDVPIEAQPRPVVLAQTVSPALHEVTAKYSGKLRPWETYSLAFEQAGRIVALGTNNKGEPLDDGDEVPGGKLLARLDDRVLRARNAEAIANFEQAASDLDRAKRVRLRDKNSLTEAEYQRRLTDYALANASKEIAAKNLEDAKLIAPVDATIARRMAEPGESVGMNQVVFELVEIDRLLLVIDVPESDIRELEERQREVEQNRKSGNTDPESMVFRAYVTPEGRDRYGNRWPTIKAEVFRIAELADPRTGLFEVEVRVPNPGGMLRPGMVCTTKLVVTRMSAYKLPETAVMFRNKGGEVDRFLFSLRPEQHEVRAMFWPVGNEELLVADRIDLPVVIDQGHYLLVPSQGIELERIVVRGQQRLSDGQLVRNSEQTEAGSSTASASAIPSSSVELSAGDDT